MFGGIVIIFVHNITCLSFLWIFMNSVYIVVGMYVYITNVIEEVLSRIHVYSLRC